MYYGFSLDNRGEGNEFNKCKVVVLGECPKTVGVGIKGRQHLG